jgi:DNA-binding SARP family transcriptional activator
MASVYSDSKLIYSALFSPNKEGHWEDIKSIIDQYQFWCYVYDSSRHAELLAQLIEFESSRMEVIPSSNLLLRESVIRVKDVIEGFKDLIQKMTSPENTVVFFEMTWAVRTPSGDIYLRELHHLLQGLINEFGFSIVCIYDESIMLDEQLLMGLFAHPFIYAGDQMKHNPYYLPAEIVKKNRIKHRFDYWLSQVMPHRESSPISDLVDKSSAAKLIPNDHALNVPTAHSEEGRWKIRCFGELRIRRENGEIIDWSTKAGSTKKLKTLFAFLLLRGSKGATVEELADVLWPDAETTDVALNRLYHSIRFLRKVLESDKKSSESSFITNQNSIYTLRLPHDSWIDLPMFQELCFKGTAHIQEGDLEQAKICYESAERLYTGDLFHDIPSKYKDDLDNDWCWSKIHWYKSMYDKLLYSLAAVYRQMGKLSLAIQYCDKALADDPHLVPALKEKMLALAEANRLDAIQRQYRIYTESLKKNLGETPSEEIRQLYLEILKKNQ